MAAAPAKEATSVLVRGWRDDVDDWVVVRIELNGPPTLAAIREAAARNSFANALDGRLTYTFGDLQVSLLDDAHFLPDVGSRHRIIHVLRTVQRRAPSDSTPDQQIAEQPSDPPPMYSTDSSATEAVSPSTAASAVLAQAAALASVEGAVAVRAAAGGGSPEGSTTFDRTAIEAIRSELQNEMDLVLRERIETIRAEIARELVRVEQAAERNRTKVLSGELALPHQRRPTGAQWECILDQQVVFAEPFRSTPTVLAAPQQFEHYTTQAVTCFSLDVTEVTPKGFRFRLLGAYATSFSNARIAWAAFSTQE
eukprot:c25640_g1_i1.p1 GENE.c25640_g1_i1~~c25640_g1_i1.p1  ORF type:complete len:318 (+),score=23.66 c25640_g1_i1:27-956(+)